MGKLPLGNLIGIDPGSHFLGLSYLTVSLTDYRIISGGAETICVDRFIPSHHQTHSEDRYFALRRYLVDYFYRIEPIAVGIESPFIQEQRPLAARPLYITNYLISQVLREGFGILPTLYWPPVKLKSLMRVKDFSSKQAVKDAVLLTEELTHTLGIDALYNYDEHSIDALCSAYGTLSAIRSSYVPRPQRFFEKANHRLSSRV